MLDKAAFPVSLKSLVPSVPRDDGEKQHLIDTLTQIGCEGLLAQPRNSNNEGMVPDFTRPRTNRRDGTLRRDPAAWTTDWWAEVYSFPKKGNGGLLEQISLVPISSRIRSTLRMGMPYHIALIGERKGYQNL